MNAKVRRKRFWAAVLCIAAVFVMTVGSLGGPTVRSVYAANEGDVIGDEIINPNSPNKFEVVEGEKINVRVNNIDNISWSENRADGSHEKIAWSITNDTGEATIEGNPEGSLEATIKGEKEGDVKITARQVIMVGSGTKIRQASQIITVTAAPAPTYNMDATVDGTSPLSSECKFPWGTEGYTDKLMEEWKRTVTIKNTGTGAFTVTQPSSKTGYFTIGELTEKGSIDPGKSTAFTIRPIEGLTEAGVVNGVYTETITITNSGGEIATINVEFKVTKPTFDFVDGTQYILGLGESHQLLLDHKNHPTGTSTVKWDPSDPSVAAVDALGTVRGLAVGVSNITATVNYPGGPPSGTDVSKTIKIRVSLDKPYITTGRVLPPGTVGQDYSQTLIATQNPGDKLSWKIVSGTWPAGLNFNQSTGTISGKPTTRGKYDFDVSVTNTTTNQTYRDTFSIVIGLNNIIYTDRGDSEITNVSSSNIASVKSSYVMTVSSKSEKTNLTDSQSSLYETVKKLFWGGISDKLETHFLEIDLKDGVTDVSTADKVIEIDLTVKFSKFHEPLFVLRKHGSAAPVMLERLASQPKSFSDGTYFYNSNTGHLYIYSDKFSSYLVAYPSVNAVLLSFNTGSGGTAVDPVFVERGASLSSLPTVPSGYEGWFTNSDYKDKVSTPVTFNESAVLYARRTSSASNASTSASTARSGTATGNNPSGTTPVNAPQTGDPIDYVRAFAALIVICAGTLVLLYTLKARRRK